MVRKDKFGLPAVLRGDQAPDVEIGAVEEAKAWALRRKVCVGAVR